MTPSAVQDALLKSPLGLEKIGVVIRNVACSPGIVSCLQQ
jgi:hypothetical protein